MKIRDLIKQLGDDYPGQSDMNYESLLSDMSIPNFKVKKISYGLKSSPIFPVERYDTESTPGFLIISEGTQVKFTYGPKVKKILLEYFKDYDCELD